jgi:hypothetical protein
MKEKSKLSLLTAIAAKSTDWSEGPELLTPVHIEDPFMRRRLISATEKMEELLTEEKIMLQTEIITKTPYGLVTKCTIDKPIENKPSITQFHYSIDTEMLKTWLTDHSYLEGPFSFMGRGIQITYPEIEVKPEHYHKLLLSLDTEKTEDNPAGKRFLDIMVKDAGFAVHRDIFSEKEWIVCQIA